MRSASEANRRCVIECIHNAGKFTKLNLIDIWSNKTPEEAHEILSREDVSVTNQKDKESQLPKIKRFKESVYQTWLTIPKDEDEQLRTIARNTPRPEGHSPMVTPGSRGSAIRESQSQGALTTPPRGSAGSFALARPSTADDVSFKDHIPVIETLTQQLSQANTQLSQAQHTIDSLTQTNTQLSQSNTQAQHTIESLSQTNTQLALSMSQQMGAMTQHNTQLMGAMTQQNAQLTDAMTELTMGSVSMQAETLSANSPGDISDGPLFSKGSPRSTGPAPSHNRVQRAFVRSPSPRRPSPRATPLTTERML